MIYYLNSQIKVFNYLLKNIGYLNKHLLYRIFNKQTHSNFACVSIVIMWNKIYISHTEFHRNCLCVPNCCITLHIALWSLLNFNIYILVRMLFKICAFLAKYNLFGVFLKNFYFIYISCNFFPYQWSKINAILYLKCTFLSLNLGGGKL